MIYIRKKVFYIFILVSVISILLVFAKSIYTEASNDEIRIIVDAGHGNPDGGAVGLNGTLEKDINLSIAKKLEEVLTAKNYTVIMTRVGDTGIYDSSCRTIRQMKVSDMRNRLAIMKNSGAKLFISIHMNSYESGKANGLHVFYSKNHSEIKPLAEEIQAGIAEITNAKTHSIKSADEKLFLMKNPPIPAILVECGFLSNEIEEQKLITETYQSKIAWAMAESVEKYLK